MSEEEKNASFNEDDQEEVDDLFGDDDEQEETTTTRPSTTETKEEDGEVDDDKDEEDNDNNNNDDDDDDDDEEVKEEEKELKTLDLTLPRHAISHKPDSDCYMIRMPVFLGVEAHPFDPNEFKEKVANNAMQRQKAEMDAKQTQNDLIAEKLLNENTIRWRYSNSGNDEIIKQSNAHFVEWDDGLISLKIGNELFDFKSTPVMDTFLARSHVDHEVLQNESIITRSANLLPSSTFTETHRRLTQAVKTIQKKDKILNTLTEKDPMLKQRMADENERKSLKMKRQIENRRRLQEEKLGKSDSPGLGYLRGSNESAYERFERTYGGQEYDDEDDFVANDDEELEVEEDDDEEEEEEFERGAERLRNVKTEGARKYEEGERKRRRIVDLDEE